VGVLVDELAIPDDVAKGPGIVGAGVGIAVGVGGGEFGVVVCVKAALAFDIEFAICVLSSIARICGCAANACNQACASSVCVGTGAGGAGAGEAGGAGGGMGADGLLTNGRFAGITTGISSQPFCVMIQPYPGGGLHGGVNSCGCCGIGAGNGAGAGAGAGVGAGAGCAVGRGMNNLTIFKTSPMSSVPDFAGAGEAVLFA